MFSVSYVEIYAYNVQYLHLIFAKEILNYQKVPVNTVDVAVDPSIMSSAINWKRLFIFATINPAVRTESNPVGEHIVKRSIAMNYCENVKKDTDDTKKIGS